MLSCDRKIESRKEDQNLGFHWLLCSSLDQQMLIKNPIYLVFETGDKEVFYLFRNRFSDRNQFKFWKINVTFMMVKIAKKWRAIFAYTCAFLIATKVRFYARLGSTFLVKLQDKTWSFLSASCAEALLVPTFVVVVVVVCCLL